jgi:hypothetical protein
MAFRSARGSPSDSAASCVVVTGEWLAEQDHPAYIPRYFALVQLGHVARRLRSWRALGKNIK